MSKADKKFQKTLEYLSKGILMGCSLGAIAGWIFGRLSWFVLLGGLCGCLASITFRNKMERLEKD